MEGLQLNGARLRAHYDAKVLNCLTTILSWGAVIAGGAARFLVTNVDPTNTLDYPEDTDIYCLGDAGLEHKVWNELRSSFIATNTTGKHLYGGHWIESKTVSCGQQFKRRSGGFTEHNIQLVTVLDLPERHTVADLWETFDMSVCEAAIVYGQNRVDASELRDIWLDDHLDMPNEKIKVIRPPLYAQLPPKDLPTSLHTFQREYVPLVGVVSDRYIASARKDLMSFRYFPNCELQQARRRVDKYVNKGYRFHWNDLTCFVNDPVSQPWLYSLMRRNRIEGDVEDMEMFKFLMDAGQADYLKEVLQ